MSELKYFVRINTSSNCDDISTFDLYSGQVSLEQDILSNAPPPLLNALFRFSEDPSKPNEEKNMELFMQKCLFNSGMTKNAIGMEALVELILLNTTLNTLDFC